MKPYIHLIALYRTNNCAMAFHFSSKTVSEIVAKKHQLLAAIAKAPRRLSIGVHLRPTAQPTYASVVEYDPYFKPFTETNDIASFVATISRDDAQ